MNNVFEAFPDSYDKSSVRIINTASSLAKATFFYVQETGYIKIFKTHTTERRNLDSFLIVYILSGKGTLNYEKKVYHLMANDCFFIDCNKTHSYQSSADEPWELLWVHFNGLSSKEYYHYFKTLYQNVFKAANAEDIIATLKELIEIHANKSIETEVLSSNLITQLLTQILLSKRQKNSKTEHINRLDQVLKYIDEHFSGKLLLDDIAEKFFISKFHLSRQFKKRFGKTISEYIIQKKITLAKRLLRYSGKSIEEIAEDCGFGDSSYFAKLFKKAENMTALSYRKKWSGQVDKKS